MPDDFVPTDDVVNDIAVLAFESLEQIAVLRRLVMSMALNISIDFMPDDEKTLLLEIMGDSS